MVRECICTSVCVTALVIKKSVRLCASFSHNPFNSLRKFVPVGNQCGKCVRAAREVMQDELMQMPEFKEIA